VNLRPTLLPALGVFAVAARHQNFALAGEELHLTASAVSHHIRKLESLLGAPLFQRHARGVTLTAEGRQLADAASAALAEVSAVAGDLRPLPETVPLRLTTLHSVSYCWLLPRLPRFCALHPHIRLEIHTGSALARFDDGGPHLAIRYGPGRWPGVTALPLMEDALFPVASPALPQLAQVREPADILQLPLLSDMSPQSWRDWLRAAGVRGVRLPPMHSFSDSTEALRAAVYGMGAVLARRLVAQPYLQRYELVRLPGPPLRPRYAYYIVHPEHQPPNAAAQLMIDWLRREALDERTPLPPLPAELLGIGES